MFFTPDPRAHKNITVAAPAFAAPLHFGPISHDLDLSERFERFRRKSGMLVVAVSPPVSIPTMGGKSRVFFEKLVYFPDISAESLCGSFCCWSIIDQSG